MMGLSYREQAGHYRLSDKFVQEMEGQLKRNKNG